MGHLGPGGLDGINNHYTWIFTLYNPWILDNRDLEVFSAVHIEFRLSSDKSLMETWSAETLACDVKKYLWLGSVYQRGHWTDYRARLKGGHQVV